MARKWNSQYSFHWNPLVAFTEKRANMAIWFQDNVKARAVLDKQDVLGVAIGHPALRVQISRSGFDISIGKSFLDVNELSHAVGGIDATIEPSGVHLAEVRQSLTTPMVGEYDELRAAFAAHCTGSLSTRYKSSDASALVDVRLPGDASLLVEYGIVTRDELAERLKRPSMSRVSQGQRMASDLSGEEDVPDTSLYFDAFWRTGSLSQFESDVSSDELWEYVNFALANVDDAVSGLSDEISANIQSLTREEGSLDEYGRGA